jgi:hypothetical protein
MPLYLKTSTATNSWREATSAYLKTSIATNSWRKIVSAFVKTADGWQLIFGSVGPQIDSPLEISSNSTLYPATLTGRNYHWDSGTTFTSKFENGASQTGPWNDVTTFENILNPASGSSNTKTLILLENHFVLDQSSTFFRFVVRAQDSLTQRETTEFSDPIEITVPDAVMSHTGGPIVATSTTISIPFTQNSFLKYYIVEAYGPSGLVSSTRVNTPSSPVVVQNLLPNTTYDIVIFPYNFVDMVGIALLGIGITTLLPVPGPVTNLNRSTGNGLSKTFTWSAPSGGSTPTGYEYQLNNFGWIDNGLSTSVSISVVNGTNTFQVRAYNGSGSGTSLSTGSFTPPVISTFPAANPVTSVSAAFSWTSSNQNSFSLSIPGAVGTPFNGTTETFYAVNNALTPNTTYTPTLTITGPNGDTATVTGPSFTTSAALPGPVNNLNRSTGNGGSKTFTWSAPTTGGVVTSYEYQLNNFGWINNGLSTSVNLTGLSGTNTFQVRAVNASGSGASVSTGSFVIPTINSGPTASLITSSGARISWTSTNQNSWSLSGVGNYSGTSQTLQDVSLSSSTTYTPTLTVTSSTGDTATVTGNSFTTPAPPIFVVTWNANGGSVSPTSNSGTAGTVISAPTPTRAGYTFLYWRDTPSGDFFYQINPGGTWTISGNITFYARWSLNVSIPSGGSVSLTGGSTPGSVITASTSGWSGSPTSYDVFITTALSPNIPTSSSSRVASSGGGTSASYTITSSDAISPVNIFRAFATASNSAGTSGVVQSPNTITTTSAPPPTPPSITSGPTISWASGNNFTLSATAANATNIEFQVEFANNSGGPALSTQTFFMGASAGSTTTGAQQYSWARTRARANNSTTGLSSAFTSFTGWA